jgi:hypothetical protein
VSAPLLFDSLTGNCWAAELRTRFLGADDASTQIAWRDLLRLMMER